MENSEVNQYVCDATIQNEKIKSFIKNIGMIYSSYDSVVLEIENFFNSQIESQDDIDMMKGEIVELSDNNEQFFFQFKKENGKLKLVETSEWKTFTALAIILQTIQDGMGR